MHNLRHFFKNPLKITMKKLNATKILLTFISKINLHFNKFSLEFITLVLVNENFSQ